MCRRPCTAALAAQSPCAHSAGTVQGEWAVPWPGALAALKEQSCFTGGKDGLCHEDAECSCFNDHTVLSSGSLLTRLPLAPWVLTSCSFQLLGLMVLPASMQQLWLQNPQVINLAAKDDKLVDLCSSLLCFWCVLVIGNYWFGGFLMLK